MPDKVTKEAVNNAGNSINVAWQWLKQGSVAQNKLQENSCAAGDRLFYQSKLHSMKFFFHYELRKTKGLCERLVDTEVLTVLVDEDPIM